MVPNCLGDANAINDWLLENSNYKLRGQIVEALGMFKCPEVNEGLHASLKKNEEKSSAVQLGEWRFQEYDPTLIALL